MSATKELEHNTIQFGAEANTGRIRYSRLQWNSPEFAPFDFYLQSKLQETIRDSNIHKVSVEQLEQHKY